MATKVAINGFGRIGRSVFRVARSCPDIEIVAINDLSEASTLAHLLKYDSTHGVLPEEVTATENELTVAGKAVQVLKVTNPADLPWRELGVDIAVEATGRFTAREDAAKHLRAGAARVVLSAPGENADLTVCMGVNETLFDPARHEVVSNASCTTNCLAPVAKILHEALGIRNGQMTTVHSYTNDQPILDLPHRDLRRARAAALSMVPTTTGATRATELVLPELAGKIDGMSVRVPTPNVSLIDLVVATEKTASSETVNDLFRQAASGAYRGILDYSELPLVSQDFCGTAASAVIDAPFTNVIGDHMVKVIAWYDNEWGYSNRVIDLIRHVADR